MVFKVRYKSTFRINHLYNNIHSMFMSSSTEKLYKKFWAILLILYFAIFFISLGILSQLNLVITFFYFALLFPIITSTIESYLVTIYHIENKQKKVTNKMIVITCFIAIAITTYTLLIDSPLLPMINFILLTCLAILFSTLIYFAIGVFLPLFFSFFVTKQIPVNRKIKAFSVAFRYTCEAEQAIHLITSIISTNLKYSYAKKPTNDSHIYFRLYHISIPGKYLFVYIKKRAKEIFLVPLVQKDFSIFKIGDIKQGKIIKDIVMGLTGYAPIQIEDDDVGDIDYYLKETTKPLLKGKKGFVKKLIFISVIVGIILLSLYYANKISNYISSKEITILDLLVVAILSSLAVGVVFKFQKIYSFLKELLSK